MPKVKSIRNFVQKRAIKREKQLEKLQEKRQTQFEDELLRTTITAIPKTTPKKIEETMEDIQKNSPTDFKAAEEALDAIGLFRENVNGAKADIMSSDPYRLLQAETLSACSRQTNKWKFFPVPMVHPFTLRLTIMTAATGKSIPKSELRMLDNHSKKIKSEIEAVYEMVGDKLDHTSTEEDFVNSLRDLYPDVLPNIDDSALNQCLATDGAPKRDVYEVDYNNSDFLDSDGNPDGFVFDPDNIGTTGSESDNTPKASEKEDDDDDDDDNESDTEEMPTIQNLQLEASFEKEDIENLNKMANNMPKPALPEAATDTATDTTSDNGEDGDFTSSFSESILKGINTCSSNKYSATPPPPRAMGSYSMVPPIPQATSSPTRPKATVTPTGTPSPMTPTKKTSRRKKTTAGYTKRLASPMDQQPPKLTRVENNEADRRQMRHDLELSNRKIASMARIIQSLQEAEHRRISNERFTNQWNSNQQQQHQQQLNHFFQQQTAGLRTAGLRRSWTRKQRSTATKP